MRIALLLALIGMVPVAAPAAQPVMGVPWMTTPWSPTSDYITPGQDEPGYRRWIVADPFRAGQVTAFHNYLTGSGVAFIVPTWQLLRTASDWQKCGASPFEVPPPSEWPNLVQTLRFVRDFVIPAVGAVEPVSGYRNPMLNRCAGGATESVHMHFSAIDLVPLRPTDRGALINRLCALYAREGYRYQVGLGFYTKLRFHVDSWKYRTWGRNDGGSLACGQWLPPPLPTVTIAQAPTTTGPIAGGSSAAAVLGVPHAAAPILVPIPVPRAAPPPAARVAGPPASDPTDDPLAPLRTDGAK